LDDALLIERHFAISVKRLWLIEVILIEAFVDDDRSFKMSFQRSASASPTRIEANTIKTTIVLVGSCRYPITRLISGNVCKTAALTGFCLRSLTAIAGFPSIMPHTTACVSAARSAACIFLIVFGAACR
jgi:hypothetical protein